MNGRTSLDLLRANSGDIARRLRMLAHPDRLIMLCRLHEGEASVGDLASLTSLSRSAVSQHLAVLRNAGAVVARADAQTRLYRIIDCQIDAIVAALCTACGTRETSA